MPHIGIIGTTGWATTLGILAARAGNRTLLLARTEVEANLLQADRENRRLLPGAAFPDDLAVTADPEAALGTADIILIAVPSVTMRRNLKNVNAAINRGAPIVCATKGIEISSGKRMSELIADELEGHNGAIGVISGPNLAKEVAAGKAASATVAMQDTYAAELVQKAFNTQLFRIYTSTDVTGVELGGALKNIIAIGAGFIDGIGLGANAKAAFVTRGLHEITRLGVSMGARPETFSGLSGMGDLIASCYSALSRNYRLGVALADGKSLEDALDSLDGTAEGVPTTRAAVRLAAHRGVEMPIAMATHAVLSGELKPEDAAAILMARKPQPEIRF
ncbi:MAG: NAD(P)-dependent glycerol-3-phosphate dehydrogenase [Chloroflexi bacterium]|nr:NAD(P)-dependent glycerol-3-phosphate dehydrogenase [Chloroflexota bacterium]